MNDLFLFYQKKTPKRSVFECLITVSKTYFIVAFKSVINFSRSSNST